MSTAEILAALPKLSTQERGVILDQIWRLEEAAGPTAGEKMVLDEAQAAYDSNPDAGATWTDVVDRLRKRI